MAEHGSAAAALAALPAIARAAGVEDYRPCPEEVARHELSRGRLAGARPLFFGEEGYPEALARLPDAPPLLWLRGDGGLLARPMVALVGARNASSLGLRMARRLAEGLVEAGFTVVSGLARGIDAAAHDAALGLPGTDRGAGQGRCGTIAVLAGGVDVIYPPENADLARRMADQGLLLSDQPPGLEPQARHFPARNRIIAGLCRAVVVVEAAVRSGSLITAREAADLGRDVLAVPGHPVDARAGGCNQLIRDGATLVRGPSDVIEALGPAVTALEMPAPDAGRAATSTAPAPTVADGAQHLRRQVAGAPAVPPSAAPGARRPLSDAARLHGLILDRLGPSPVAEDQLIRDLALPPALLAPELLRLELDGQIRRQPGGLLSLS
jgi:DNA processing protein